MLRPNGSRGFEGARALTCTPGALNRLSRAIKDLPLATRGRYLARPGFQVARCGLHEVSPQWNADSRLASDSKKC